MYGCHGCFYHARRGTARRNYQVMLSCTTGRTGQYGLLLWKSAFGYRRRNRHGTPAIPGLNEEEGRHENTLAEECMNILLCTRYFSIRSKTFTKENVLTFKQNVGSNVLPGRTKQLVRGSIFFLPLL